MIVCGIRLQIPGRLLHVSAKVAISAFNRCSIMKYGMMVTVERVYYSRWVVFVAAGAITKLW